MTMSDTYLQQFTKQADALQAADRENAKHARAQQHPKPAYEHQVLRSRLPDDAAARMARCHPEIFLSGFTPTEVSESHAAPSSGAKRPRLSAAPSGCTFATVSQAARPGAVQLGVDAPHVGCAAAPLAQNVRTWVQEKAGKDKHGGPDYVLRLYTAASVDRFWRHSESLPPAQRHCYELLREGQQCNLYFDLEYAKALNPGFDGDSAVLTLLVIVRDLARCASAILGARQRTYPSASRPNMFPPSKLLLHCNLSSRMLSVLHVVPLFGGRVAHKLSEVEACRALWDIHIADSDVLESDSSTETKWSRHLTVRLPGHAFASSVAVGVFVKDHVLRHTLAEQLLVAAPTMGADSVQTSTVDDAVYTKCAASPPHDVRSQRRYASYQLGISDAQS